MEKLTDLLDKKKAMAYVKNYFSTLKETGYVSPSSVSRYLVYLFLIDFVDTLYPYITYEDYMEIDKLLGSIFGTGGCLLPYPVFCKRKINIGRYRYPDPSWLCVQNSIAR